ncbi:MAG: hypothetical protein DRP87_00555 [Spirochaetes bacterium]|nr:MAG: hypothetical protein DRP87_00555 [Spirochaetota bacterium]
MSPFFSGEIDIWAVYLIDEVLTAHEKNIAVNVILPEYYGVHIYGMILVTTDSLIQENPELVNNHRQSLRLCEPCKG